MTDNEIIKGMKHCSTGRCNAECPYADIEGCMEKNGSDILDLINRQKAEIACLKNKQQATEQATEQVIEQVRAEAIKEFAYRLRQRSYKSSDWSRGEHPMIVEWDDIDDVLEEMAGERE